MHARFSAAALFGAFGLAACSVNATHTAPLFRVYGPSKAVADFVAEERSGRPGFLFASAPKAGAAEILLSEDGKIALAQVSRFAKAAAAHGLSWTYEGGSVGRTVKLGT